MRAMILAAGRGERLRPLTDHTPKPLLTVKGRPLIDHHLHNLAKSGFREIVINLGHLGQKLKDHLKEGQAFGLNIQYSEENPVLETGGGIVKALPLLGEDPFLVLSADLYTDFPFETLPKNLKSLAHLVLVNNPPHHKKGDYALENGFVVEGGSPLYNFAGIGVYSPQLFQNCELKYFRLPDLFKASFPKRQITGEIYGGLWHNIGSKEQLEQLNDH